MEHRRSVRGHRFLKLALAGVVTTLLAVPGVALAVESPPAAPPDADADCTTVPQTYPGNGVPVPPGAGCDVVTTSDDVATAEVWSWADDAGLHWYNYAAEGYSAASGPLLTMCASSDDADQGVVYECTPDSYDLLFTLDNLFVTWPAEDELPLHFCESVELVNPLGAVTTGHACGSLAESAEGGEAPPPPTTQPPTTTAPPPVTESPPPPTTTSAPVQTPTEEESEEPVAVPSTAVVVPSAPAPSVSAATTAVATTTAAVEDPRLPPTDPPPAAEPTPVDSESVAMVNGSAFPVTLVVALAGALALGGITVLAGPGAVAALRRRF